MRACATARARNQARADGTVASVTMYADTLFPNPMSSICETDEQQLVLEQSATVETQGSYDMSTTGQESLVHESFGLKGKNRHI